MFIQPVYHRIATQTKYLDNMDVLLEDLETGEHASIHAGSRHVYKY